MNVALSTLALCAGYGGLELGLDAACTYLGFEHRVACYVEREAYAAALLAARMETGALAQAPIWSDLVTFDAGAWRGAVDCVAAGFPCQPHSHAGKRLGTDDERWIWPSIRDLVRDSGAWLVVLENVPGLFTSGGFDEVLRDLDEMGFRVEWGSLAAADVGASHQRVRVFILAYLPRERRGETWGDCGRGAQWLGREGDELADATGAGRHEGQHEFARQQRVATSDNDGRAMANAERREGEQRYTFDLQRRRPGEAEQTRLGRVGLADTGEPRCEGREQLGAHDSPERERARTMRRSSRISSSTVRTGAN